MIQTKTKETPANQYDRGFTNLSSVYKDNTINNNRSNNDISITAAKMGVGSAGAAGATGNVFSP